MANILLVDDDPTVRAIATELLRADRHTVVEAADGDEALRSLETTHADLVVLDILMPNRDGLETTKAIRRRHPGVRILAISAGGSMDSSSLLKLAEVFGADETLAKPLSFTTFAATVNRLLEIPAASDPFAAKA